MGDGGGRRTLLRLPERFDAFPKEREVLVQSLSGIKSEMILCLIGSASCGIQVEVHGCLLSHLTMDIQGVRNQEFPPEVLPAFKCFLKLFQGPMGLPFRASYRL